jgi:CBS domain-containing protein
VTLIDVATPLARVPAPQPREPLFEVLARRAITDPEVPVVVLDGGHLVGILTTPT